MSLDADRLKPFLAWVGLASLAAAGAVYLVLEEFGLPARLLAGLGALLVGAYVALDPEDFWERLRAQRTLYGGNTLIAGAVFLGILALINVLGARFSTRWDLTASQQFTLSDQTKRVVAGLKQPVQITLFFTSDDPRRQTASDLIKEYRALASVPLDNEVIDPELDPATAINLGVREFGTVVFQQGEKRQTTTTSSESSFTTALIKLTRAEPKKIYFTQGHGERNLNGRGQTDYGDIRERLGNDGFAVEPLSLLTSASVPSDASILVVAGPTNDLLDEEKKAITSFLDAGGRVILMKDPRAQVDLNALISRWGVQFGNGLLADPALAFLGDPLAPVVQSYGNHTITEQLRTATFFPEATNLIVNQQRETPGQVTILAQTSNRSWVETNPQAVSRDENDLAGPAPLVVAIEADAPNAVQRADGTKPKAQAVVFGDSDFVSNNFLRIPSGNADLFLNSANWLAGEHELVTIRPREIDDRRMFLTGAQVNLIFFSSVLFLPALVLVAGAVVWWSRR